MDFKDIEIFEGKTLSELFQEIHANSVEKKNKIVTLIEDIRPMIKNAENAMVLVPIIKEYMDVSVKNDENLIKLAMVIQRIISKQNEATAANEFALSEEEKKKLIGEAQKVYDNIMSSSSQETTVPSVGATI